MARTRRTTRKSTGHPPVGQLALQHVPPTQAPRPVVPQNVSQEGPFVIDLVIPESPAAQGSLAKKQ
jgi:hypothetical protein